MPSNVQSASSCVFDLPQLRQSSHNVRIVSLRSTTRQISIALDVVTSLSARNALCRSSAQSRQCNISSPTPPVVHIAYRRTSVWCTHPRHGEPDWEAKDRCVLFRCMCYPRTPVLWRWMCLFRLPRGFHASPRVNRRSVPKRPARSSRVTCNVSSRNLIFLMHMSTVLAAVARFGQE